MKVIISILILADLVLGELPPPYPPRGFRPNPPFNLPIRQPQTSYEVPNAAPSKFSQFAPQTQYGTPNQQGSHSAPSLTPSFNSKQTIPSTSYGVPVTSSPYRTIQSESQISSGFPSQQRARPASSLTPNFSSKQTVPGTFYEAPATSSPYRTIVSEPQTSYGTPNGQNHPSSQYGAPDSRNIEALEQIRQLNLLLQMSHSSKSNQQNQDFNLPQSPNSNRNIEIPSQQYLPIKEAANFRDFPKFPKDQVPQGNIQQSSQQYLPVKEPTNFRDGVDLSQSNFQEPFDLAISNPNLRQQSQQFLPVKQATNFKQETANLPNNNLGIQNYNLSPNNQQLSLSKFVDSSQQHQPRTTNAANNVQVERLNVRRLPNSKEQTSAKQNVAQPTRNIEKLNDRYLPPTSTVSTIHRPTRVPALSPNDNSNEDDQSTESKEEAGGPNIAIATAVSGAAGGQSFYLLQPDGRLQRVIYQKTQADGDRETEYTANYLFQNIQADPGLVYSPLITLGKR